MADSWEQQYYGEHVCFQRFIYWSLGICCFPFITLMETGALISVSSVVLWIVVGGREGGKRIEMCILCTPSYCELFVWCNFSTNTFNGVHLNNSPRREKSLLITISLSNTNLCESSFSRGHSVFPAAVTIKFARALSCCINNVV